MKATDYLRYCDRKSQSTVLSCYFVSRFETCALNSVFFFQIPFLFPDSARGRGGYRRGRSDRHQPSDAPLVPRQVPAGQQLVLKRASHFLLNDKKSNNGQRFCVHIGRIYSLRLHCNPSMEGQMGGYTNTKTAHKNVFVGSFFFIIRRRR